MAASAGRASIGAVPVSVDTAGRVERFKQKYGTVGAEQATCSARINSGKEAFLSFKLTKLPGASSTPYELIVPGLDNQKIQLQVP